VLGRRSIIPGAGGLEEQVRLSDFRSDALSSPTPEMWGAMQRTKPGWALSGEDETIAELESVGARLLGKEAALFVPTCSMANLLAIMTTCNPGDTVLLGATSHIASSEAASLQNPLGVHPILLSDEEGCPEPRTIAEAADGSSSSALPKLVCLENAHNNAGGVAVSATQMEAVAQEARRIEAPLHLDGARLFNAAVTLSIPPSALVEQMDSVSISLNKGLCAPWGALLVGPAAMIFAARQNAARIGAGSVHKAGILAAAALVALSSMRERLLEDNQRAVRLAALLAQLPGLKVINPGAPTNIVLADTAGVPIPASEIESRLRRHGVLSLARSSSTIRFVTYRDIADDDIEWAAGAFKQVLSEV
jgi:threonine aldolase